MVSFLFWVQECGAHRLLRLGIKYTSFFPIRWLQKRYVSSIAIPVVDSKRPTRILFVGHLDQGEYHVFPDFRAMKTFFQFGGKY